jgi:hypothetical protein
MAAMNKCLARNNKSRTRASATYAVKERYRRRGAIGWRCLKGKTRYE